LNPKKRNQVRLLLQVKWYPICGRSRGKSPQEKLVTTALMQHNLTEPIS